MYSPNTCQAEAAIAARKTHACARLGLALQLLHQHLVLLLHHMLLLPSPLLLLQLLLQLLRGSAVMRDIHHDV